MGIYIYSVFKIRINSKGLFQIVRDRKLVKQDKSHPKMSLHLWHLQISNLLKKKVI